MNMQRSPAKERNTTLSTRMISKVPLATIFFVMDTNNARLGGRMKDEYKKLHFFPSP